MNQQDEIAAIDAMDAKITQIGTAVMGLEGKVADLETALSQQGAFVPQAVADKLAALKAHIASIATAAGVAPDPADSPAADSPPSTTPTTPDPNAVGAMPIGNGPGSTSGSTPSTDTFSGTTDGTVAGEDTTSP